MTDCAHWHRQELFEEEVAAKDREIMAAHQRTAALEEKLRRIRELTEGIERPKLLSLEDAFEMQRAQAQAQGLANARNNALGAPCSQQPAGLNINPFSSGFFGLW